MAYKTGASKAIAHGTSGTFGTADAVTTGDKLIVDSFAFNKNPEELTETGIGSGNDMAADAAQGATTPTITVTKTAYYNDAGWQAVANFFQGESVTGNANGYTHSFIHGGFNQKYLTTVAQYAANSVLEAASGAVTRLQMTFSNPPNYSKLSYDILANDIIYTGTTNSYAVVDATTVANTKKIFAKAANTISICGLTVPVTDVDIVLTKEQAAAREMKGSAGNGSPIPSGDPPYQGTVTVTLATLADHTYFTGAASDSLFYMTTTHTGDALSLIHI